MKLFIDTANLDEIREIASWGVLAGVTTNPSLVAREGGDFIQRVVEICEIVRGPVSAEVLAQDVDGMVREGRLLADLSEHVVVKAPLTEAGIAATAQLASEGIKVNVTLCFQAAQALLAAKAGAAYISPFVGRVDDVSWDGNELISQIVDVYAADPEITTEVLAASIRHPMHLVQAALAGAHVATVPYAVLKKAIKHPLTDSGNTAFLKDWEKVPAEERDIATAVARWRASRG
ncbi:MAG: fructose-6-phosphate aldolase [Alphaproteobacteria bacterium]|nr:fructose-6-phosphate aldolase [Alphaproteobacteria bacterium]